MNLLSAARMRHPFLVAGLGMATDVETFLDTRTGGFLAGVGVVVGLAAAIRFGPTIVVRQVLPRIPNLLTKKVAEFIVHDTIIGRVPLLQLDKPILSLATIGGTVFTTGFYLFGGMDMVKEVGRELAGFPLNGTGNPDEDSVTFRLHGPVMYRINSESQRLIMVAQDGSRRDP